MGRPNETFDQTFLLHLIVASIHSCVSIAPHELLALHIGSGRIHVREAEAKLLVETELSKLVVTLSQKRYYFCC
jgi:hypothetical protein